jgi:hypothetical protein
MKRELSRCPRGSGPYSCALSGRFSLIIIAKPDFYWRTIVVRFLTRRFVGGRLLP